MSGKDKQAYSANALNLHRPNWSQTRQELIAWLSDRAPTFVDGYAGAVELLDQQEFPGRVHLVSHVVRDIYRHLPVALGIKPQPRSGEVLPNMVRELAITWDTDPPHDTVTVGDVRGHFISSGIFRHVENLVAKSRQFWSTAPVTNAARQRQKGTTVGEQLARALFRSIDRRDGEFIQDWIIAAFDAEYKFFVSRAHFNCAYNDDGLKEHFEAFERAFHSLVGQYFIGKDELDELLCKTNAPGAGAPTPDQVKVATQRMRSPEFGDYFLSRLENPEWIVSLKESELFASPPPPIRTNGGTAYPRWSASQFLARMAHKAPGEVAKLALTLKTDNASVISDILDAALVMPPGIATTLVAPIAKAARRDSLGLSFGDASELCLKLVNGGEVDAALPLAEALFTPKPTLSLERPNRNDEHWYKKGLAEVAPVLAIARPQTFLPTLCGWLEAAVRAKKYGSADSTDDMSYIWRPAVEEHEQNGDYDFAGAIVGFVRDAFEQAIRQGAITLDEALGVLDARTLLIFQRLRIHLIAEFGNQQEKLAREVILNHDLFDDPKYKHEYAMLVGRCWDLLTSKEKNVWLRWVDVGPDMSDYDDDIQRNLGRAATPADRDGRKRYWQYEKLHWIRDHLSGPRQGFYRQMQQEYGEPEMADLNIRSGTGWSGKESPVTVEELAEKGFEEAVKFAAEWRPTGRRYISPSIDGLASTFRQYVATDRAGFSRLASILKHRPAIYVRSYIEEMAEAAKLGEDIDLIAVVNLCRWVLDRPPGNRTVPEREDEGHIDNDWQWIRDEISRLMKELCKAQLDAQPRLPLDHRELIWSVISALSKDPARSYLLDDKAAEDPRLRDYLNFAINSPRGKAVDAALEYARWLGKHFESEKDRQDVLDRGFARMPEVREMLEWQINPANRSVEAMAILGHKLGLIYWLDKDWLRANAAKLFDLNAMSQQPAAANTWAAWNAFLVWVRPHPAFYDLFNAQFSFAVDQAAQVELSKQGLAQPMERLGEHLMVLFGRGALDLDEGSPLRKFIAAAQPNIRSHAIHFVGRSLEGEGEVPQDVLNRFMSLWDVYWGGRGPEDAKQKPDAWLFGSWFACGKFPPEWSISCLLEYVEIAALTEPDPAVIEQLAAIAHVDVLAATKILDRVVRADKEGWWVHGWKESAQSILAMAMKTDSDVRGLAEELINYLGRQGHLKFGELLKDLR